MVINHHFIYNVSIVTNITVQSYQQSNMDLIDWQFKL